MHLHNAFERKSAGIGREMMMVMERRVGRQVGLAVLFFERHMSL